MLTIVLNIQRVFVLLLLLHWWLSIMDARLNNRFHQLCSKIIMQQKNFSSVFFCFFCRLFSFEKGFFRLKRKTSNRLWATPVGLFLSRPPDILTPVMTVACHQELKRLKWFLILPRWRRDGISSTSLPSVLDIPGLSSRKGRAAQRSHSDTK